MPSPALLSLFIVIPLGTAAFAAINPARFINRVLNLAVPAFGAAGGAYLLVILRAGDGVVADNVGAFASGISIPFVADTLTALMLVASAVVAFAANWFADVVGESQARFYPALCLMLLGGAWGALLTADLFNLFVFIEVMLMPSFGLLAMTGTWARLAAARMFIVVNLITSMLLLTGVALTYGVVGTTNLAALAGAAGPRGTEHFAPGVFGTQWQLLAALGVVLLALAVKAGLAPVHTWLPRAYPATSPAVMALFSGLHTKVAVYAIFRVFMVVFEGDPAWAWGILGFTVAGMLIGAFAGLAESSMRAVLGYQMVNGVPFMLIALAFVSNNGTLVLSAALYYMVHHMVVACSLITAAGSIEETYGFGKIRPLSGLLHRDPFPSVVFAAGALAIVGFPPFSGLWGKLALIWGIAHQGSWLAWTAIIAIIVAGMGALLSMLYVWREVFWGRPMNPNEAAKSLAVNRRFVYPSAVLMALSLVMFAAAGPLFNITGRAAKDLTDTTAYVRAVSGGERLQGQVLTPGPSGLDHIPADQRGPSGLGGAQRSLENAVTPGPEDKPSGQR
ncbi:monovalent cation/H+ antiporter subunit D family protein [Corynebacterium heidelbergense]|uniref:Cation:proton antiporter n=1 Tax=Corynebacterium heidelbergense TaxID=2055947 RepID=A0A364VB26_9CORY|nr:monovalent cation/H+ antiporter subunit D family protein [Corynebacterium heidelbergense]RAV33824.1 cation:proton antiporter [Corynebacterium heidelbergense]WCZ37494.1 Na(+)/H(+) antiporter subunit D [Corynebacterium heidelbergense]